MLRCKIGNSHTGNLKKIKQITGLKQIQTTGFFKNITPNKYQNNLNFKVLTTGAEQFPVRFEFTVENSPSERVIFVMLVTSVLSSLSLVNRGHDGDCNFHIGEPTKEPPPKTKQELVSILGKRNRLVFSLFAFVRRKCLLPNQSNTIFILQIGT